MCTTSLTELNIVAVLVASLVYFFLGALWYSPALFGPLWIKLSNISPDKSKSIAGLMVATYLLNLVISFAIAYLVITSSSAGMGGGLCLGVLIAFGLIATTMAINALYSEKPFKLYLIDTGYHVGGIILAAVILALWQ